MPKNKGKGGKKRKRGQRTKAEDNGGQLEYKGPDQEYALVTAVLGDRRFRVKCSDGINRIAHARGNMRKRVWIMAADVVLIALREYQDDKCDIILKYTSDEVRKLQNRDEIPKGLFESETKKPTGFQQQDGKEEDEEATAGFTFDEI